MQISLNNLIKTTFFYKKVIFLRIFELILIFLFTFAQKNNIITRINIIHI